MESEELGGSFVIAVEEHGPPGLWSSIKEAVELRQPIHSCSLSNKVGKVVHVDKLPVQYVLASDKRLARLKPFSHSPVTWFRNPYAHLILVCTADANEYRSTTRAQIKKAISDIEREWGGPLIMSEWLIVYVRPFELDPQDKSAKKMYDKIRDDFSSKKRERVVRLDIPYKFDPRRVPATGLDEFEACVKECVRASFEIRQAAYDEEVKKLLNDRLEPSWNFTTLYLVKDSFALMLECAGLYEDAFKEYLELETCYLETLARGAAASMDFGSVGDGDDVAALLSASWRVTRRLVLKKNGVPEFHFRQYLFASQARVLLKLRRPVDVAERGLHFVQGFWKLLAEKEAAGLVKPLFKEAWAFTACLALVLTTTNFAYRPESFSQQDWDAAEQLAAAVKGGTRRYTSQQRYPEDIRTPSRGGARPSAIGNAGAAGAGADPSGLPASWELGLAAEGEPPQLDLGVLAGQAIQPSTLTLLRIDGESRARDVLEKLFHCYLGHLYHAARGEVLRLGEQLKLQQAAGPWQAPPGTPQPSAVLQGQLLAQFQALMSTPACGFSELVTKATDSWEYEAEDESVRAGSPGRARMAGSPSRLGIRAAAGRDEQSSPLSMDDSAQIVDSAADYGTLVSTNLASVALPSVKLPATDADSDVQSNATLPLVSMDTAASQQLPDMQDRSARGAQVTLTPAAHHHSRTQSGASVGSAAELNASGSSGVFQRFDLLSQRPPGLPSGSASRLLSPRQAETQVDSVLSPRGAGIGSSHSSPLTAAAVATLGSADVVKPPAWISDWRLRAALAGPGAYEDLVRQLTLLSAWCYCKCGRIRTSALLYADVAVMLLQRGQVDAACRLLERMMHIVAAEGWHGLLGQLLPKLIACQRLVQHVMLPYTCMRMLALPPEACDPEDRAAVLQELMACTALPASRQNDMLVTAIQLQTLQAIQVAPAPGVFSRFRGMEDAAGAPLLQPPAWGSSPGGCTAEPPAGAPLICVGDGLQLHVDVHNNLPQPVQLHNMQLVLTQLHKAAWLYSSSNNMFGASPQQKQVRGSGASDYSSSSSPRIPAVGRVQGQGGGDSPKVMYQRWQEGEDLVCTRILHLGPAPAAAASANSSATLDPADFTPPPPGSVVLAPGVNRLVFSALPQKEGLYVLKHITAVLGNFDLRINMMGKQQLRAGAHHGSSAAPSERGSTLYITANHGVASSLGAVMPDGEISEEIVAVKVDPPRKRVAMGLAAMQGSVVAGQGQWLGLLLRPMHEPLHKARLHVQSRAASEFSSSQQQQVAGPQVLDIPSQQCVFVVDLQQQQQQQSSPGPSGRSSSTDDVAGQWCLLNRGTLELTQQLGHPITGPLLVWMQVHGSAWAPGTTSIRIHKPGLHPSTSSSKQRNVQQQQQQAQYTPPRLPPEQSHEQTPEPAQAAALAAAEPPEEPEALASIDLNLEYYSGFWRSHSSVLAVPVQPPFRVTTRAHQLPQGTILLQLSVRADAALPVVLRRAQLVLQYGVELQRDISAAALQLPLVLQPRATACFSYMVSKQDLPAATQYDEPAGSSLHIEYDAVTAAAASIPIQEICLPFSTPVADVPLPPPPTCPLPLTIAPSSSINSSMRASTGAFSTRTSSTHLPPAAAAAAAAADSPGGSPQAPAEPGCSSFSYSFQLEFPDLTKSDKNVTVRLLGPYTAHAGEAVALAWQLTRTAAPAAAAADVLASADQEDEVLCYEVSDREGKGCWSSLLAGKGVVRLGRALGAVATVEAVVLPLAAGRCRPPELVVTGAHKHRLVSEEEQSEGDVVLVYA